MKLSQLTRAEVAYLQMMYRLNESDGISSVSALAKKFDVRLPTAIEILRKLRAKGLVVQEPWRVPKLTSKGVAMAESVMHHHRIVELYLNSTLGLNSQVSCAEAAKVDYLFDETVIDEMCRVLNRPEKCLHGNPIKHKAH